MKTLASFFTILALGLCLAINIHAQGVSTAHGIATQPEGTLMVFDRSGEGCVAPLSRGKVVTQKTVALYHYKVIIW